VNIAETHIRTITDQDGAVVLDINRDQFFSMNAVGTFIWTRLLDNEDIERIAEALASETGMDLSVVSADVNDFIADLKNKQLFQTAT
jgi:hypothetical protein